MERRQEAPSPLEWTSAVQQGITAPLPANLRVRSQRQHSPRQPGPANAAAIQRAVTPLPAELQQSARQRLRTFRAAAPAASSVVRSASVSWSHWATNDPKAPPVIMIGPSAPNGQPPEPIATAAGKRLQERDLRIYACASQEDCLNRFWNSVSTYLV